MKYEFKQQNEILLVGVSGELDHHEAKNLRESIDKKVIALGVTGLIIDLSMLDMMDSSGIGVIMGRCKLLESLGGHVCVSGANETIKKVILLSGLGKLVGVCDSNEMALKMLRKTKKIG